ncbi:MAG: Hsp20 family protein [Oscillospiraceae bacterium]|nr:Hsp20 family protein [Oscillospiraceae bacterium]
MSYSLQNCDRDSFPSFFDAFEFPFNSDFRFGKGFKKSMKADVIKNKDGYVIKIDLPGIDEKDVNVRLKNGILTVSIEKKKEKEEKNDKDEIICSERSEFHSSRSFQVGKNVKSGDISAALKNGVLTINVKTPEQKEEEEKVIRIQA